MTACREAQDLARFVDGEFTRNEQEALEAHMHGCARCRVTVEAFRSIAADLARDPIEEFPDLAPLVLARAEMPTPRRRGFVRPVATALAVAAAFAVGIGVEHQRGARDRSLHGDEGAFQARGGHDSPDRWVAIHPYLAGAAPGDPRPHPLADGAAVENCHRSLLFAYDNGGPHPYRFVMIVGVDETGKPIWFFPEGKPGAASIAAEAGMGRELHEEVDLDTVGRLRLFGLFSETPLAASDVEQRLGGRPALDRVPLDETVGQHHVDLLINRCRAGE